MLLLLWLLQGLLTLCGMHDSEAKPILLCSSKDNSVHLYDLPSLVFSWLTSLSFEFEFLLGVYSCFQEPTLIYLFSFGLCWLDFRRGVKFLLNKRFVQFRWVLLACFLPVMEPVK